MEVCQTRSKTQIPNKMSENQIQEDESMNYSISEALLRKKLGQIIGFAIDSDVTIEMITSLLKAQGQTDLLSQVQRAIAEREQVKTQEAYQDFFRKDIS